MTTTSAQADGESRLARPAPTWVVWVTPALALLGLALSSYLTATHFDPQALYCQKGFFNCQAVTTSWESHPFGIPVVFLGLAQFVAMTALCSPWAWRTQRREVHVARLVLATAGMVFVLWLLLAELVLIKDICEYCTGVHLVGSLSVGRGTA